MSQEISGPSSQEPLASTPPIDEPSGTHDGPNVSVVIPALPAEFSEGIPSIEKDKTPSRVSGTPPASSLVDKASSADSAKDEDTTTVDHVHIIDQPESLMPHISPISDISVPEPGLNDNYAPDSLPEAQHVAQSIALEGDTHQADLEHNFKLLREFNQGSDTGLEGDGQVALETVAPPSAQSLGDGEASNEAHNTEHQRPVMLSKRFLKNKKKEHALQWGSGIAQAAAARFHALQAERAAASTTDIPHQEPSDPQDPNDLSWMAHVSEKVEDHEFAEQQFKKLKAKYLGKVGRATNKEEDDVDFARAEREEETRLRRLQGKRAYDEYEKEQAAIEHQENAMFYPDNEDGPPQLPGYFPASKGPPAKKRMIQKLQPGQFEDDSEVDVLGARKKRGRPKSRKSPAKKAISSKVTKSKAKTTKKSEAKERSGRKKRPQMSNVGSIFRNNILANARANEGLEAQPSFGDKGPRDKALKHLIASITQNAPTKEESQAVIQDKNAVLDALKNFSSSRTIRPNPQTAQWRLKGMRSALEHYQLLGAGWMRERENSRDRPHGGLQSDDMGLGKTVQTIAVICDSRPPLSAKCRSTLIVMPSHLLGQWMDEFRKHVEPDTLPRIMQYASRNFINMNAVSVLQEQDVVLTSYWEVAHSYPRCQPPLHLTTDEEKNKWWQAFYAEKRGDLHRVYWNRIVIDECHYIKNNDGKASVAVRALSGKYRWALSGTPCTNHPGELYPLMNFLRVENTGSQELFMKNYGRMSSEAAVKRMHALLSNIMIRRTHADRLFNRPLVKLPKIRQTTITVHFNKVEKAIYSIVEARFVNKIHTFERDGQITRKAYHIFGLMIRLRMIVSHVLLIQSTLETLLEAEDLERLWKLTETDMRSDAGASGRAILKELKKQIAEAQKVQGQSGSQDTAQSTEGPSADKQDMSGDTGKEFGVAYKFRLILTQMRENGLWEERNRASLCKRCQSPAETPKVLDPCGHLYCADCLDWMMWQVDLQEQEGARCYDCDIAFNRAEPLHGFEAAGKGALTNPASTPPGNQKALNAENVKWISLGKEVLYSAKTLAVKSQILHWLEKAPSAKIKVLIFTQFLGLVRILKRICRTEGWGCVTLTGAQSFESRNKALRLFSEEPDCKVMIASLRCGGTGLNLTMASKVILLDLWFNLSGEKQAIGRVFRIGQTQDVEVVRFVVANSIDYHMMKMQDRKNFLIEKAFDRDGVNHNWTTEELIKLFRPGGSSEDDNLEDEGFTFVEDEPSDDGSDVNMETDFRLPARPF